MTRIQLDRGERDSVRVVKAALEQMDSIDEYCEEGSQIIAKTTVDFPRILWSYGETIYIDIHESNTPTTTPIEITAEKDIILNIGSNPQQFKRRLTDIINRRRQKPTPDPSRQTLHKEVRTSQNLTRGNTRLLYTIIATMLLFLVLWAIILGV
jgi:hypothetical protein